MYILFIYCEGPPRWSKKASKFEGPRNERPQYWCWKGQRDRKMLRDVKGVETILLAARARAQARRCACCSYRPSSGERKLWWQAQYLVNL